MDGSFLQDRITKTKALIEALEDAELALMSGEIQSYTLDTGQSRQTVTYKNPTEIRKYIDSLYNRLATLCARAGDGGSVRVSPGW